MAIVYKITNTVNDKIYIGYTSKTLEHRWKQHIHTSKKSKCFFANSIRKHGAAAFKIEVLIEDTDDLWCLNFAEPLLIEFFNSTDVSIGYNSTSGGSGIYLTAEIRAKRSATITNPEYRAKRAAASKANWANPEMRAKRSATITNPEFRAKQAASIKASLANPEIRAKRSAGYANPEYKAKCSATSKANWANPEYKAKRAAGYANPEYKAKRAAASKANWANPEYKAKRAATITNPEFRAKQAAASKANWANPEFRAKRAATITNPEFRAKQAASIKASWVTRKLLKLSINESGLSPEIHGTSSRVDP